MAALQEQRDMAFHSPLGEDVLLFHSLSGDEGLSRLFEYQVDLLSEDYNLRHEDLLGRNVSVRLTTGEGSERYLNGIACSFSYLGDTESFARYRVVMRPWLWLLTRTSDCRIYQHKTVPQIVEDCFRELGFTDFESRLMEDYPEQEFRVQFKESLCNFLMRIMEEVGIYFYFRHDKDKHTLVLADSYSAHDPITGYEEVNYHRAGGSTAWDFEHLTHLTVREELQTGTVTLNAYDFENPTSSRLVRSADPEPHAHSDFEVYEFSDNFVDAGEGEAFARKRLEEQKAHFELAEAQGNARGLTPGGLFKLVDHPRDDQNREYLIVTTEIEMLSDSYISQAEAPEAEPFNCRLTAIDSRCPYRPPRVTPKPLVKGPQTATVAGKSGEEIWTDKYGRIKVQFHWDREGKSDENSSCWVRVVQNRAGKGWGEIYLPHVGQEVVVSFFGGDPDLPFVTGRLYNADNMPPLQLPDMRTQLTMRDHGGNQITMEGDKNKQQIKVYSPTLNTYLSMGQPDTTYNITFQSLGLSLFEFKNYKKEHNGSEVKETIFGKEFKDVTGDCTVKYGGYTNTTTLGNSFSETIGTKHSLTVGQTTSIFVGAKYAYDASVAVSRTDGHKYTVSNSTEHKKANANVKESTAGRHVHTVGAASTLTAKNIVRHAKNTVYITGDSAIKIKSGGTKIDINGSRVFIESADIFLKGEVTITKNLVVNGKINDQP